jgi:hypothetical protein
LKAWEIFLSSWCVSGFVIFIIYNVWSSIQWTPPPPEARHGIPGSASLGAGIIALFTIITLSLLTAAICTIAYIVYRRYKKPQTQKPT